MIDYHMHFEYLEYTEEDMKRFAKTAQKRGITQLGITEHTHGFKEFKDIYFNEVNVGNSELGNRQRGWLEGDRKFFRTLEEYVEFIEKMKKKGYPVKLGIEVCYFPGREEEIKRILEPYPWDFIMASVHFIEGWAFDLSDVKEEFNHHNLVTLYQKYSDHLVSLSKSGCYDIIGHPYSLLCYGHYPNEDLSQMYNSTAAEIAKYGTHIEINTGILYRYPAKKMTPPEPFLKACQTAGVPITLSSDAHQPEDVGRHIDDAIQFALKCGYTSYSMFEKRRRQTQPLKPIVL